MKHKWPQTNARLRTGSTKLIDERGQVRPVVLAARLNGIATRNTENLMVADYFTTDWPPAAGT